ncbi:MAG: calcineurin-like phosphoesterase C-terminal domain-containing protein [Bacteroidetes bacterium]|uniref:Calcineurin-like phosphoesterase C-terminal domain-containing protein n=1 Tax=Candidatus Cryptobacteroides faecipullorum TaxID=2840764 RepID=A0A9D9I5W2_9BACT|nr:calcineurin-like phosphoesterase C-terminal domain-containing protein [Candidatus Cryptobacteroides faecipullorum]
MLNIPESVIVDSGDMELSFRVVGGKAPLATDKFEFTGMSGTVVCDISSITDRYVYVVLPDGFENGEYEVYVSRGSQRKLLGETSIFINDAESGVEIDEGTTVYGYVTCDGTGVPGVVVSDGVEVVTTDEKGFYQIASEKKWGYVFISVPSGYEVPSEGILPQFHRYLKSEANVIENANFTLTAVSSQDQFKILMLGDMHLANRTGDLSQFSEFTSEVNDYVNARSGEKIYAITLGDMTWDLYWYSNLYYFPEYLATMNSAISNLQVFHTMGNHDNDFKTYSDFDAAFKYVRDIAPTYYSFNIGKVHFIVLDDIDCDKYDGTNSRNYVKTISNEQLEWLRKDLSYVDKSTPLIVTMHAQVFYPSGSGFKIDHDQTNTAELFNILDGYKVHFVTGHTHMSFNVVPEESVTGGRDFFEHNAGSICASWWWSGHLTPGVHISLDGTPGGYSIWNINGTDMQWIYKSTGFSEDYQFRSYDLNNVKFSYDDVPNLKDESVKKDFKKYIDSYPGQSDNAVLINIWNWNPHWKLEVTDEHGASLEYEEVWAYDPLHIAALSVKRFNSNIDSAPNFITEDFPHFFKVMADSPDTDLTIKVSDEFGHTWVENMERPKAFSTDAYKK